MVQPRLASSSLPMACAHTHSNGTPCNGFWDNHEAREEDETAVLLLVLGLTARPEGSACRSVFKGLWNPVGKTQSLAKIQLSWGNIQVILQVWWSSVWLKFLLGSYRDKVTQTLAEGKVRTVKIVLVPAKSIASGQIFRVSQGNKEIH